VPQQISKDMIPMLFIPPHGAPMAAQDFAIIESTLLNSDPGYWESGSGDAGLHEIGSENQLIFQFVRGRGFCVVHESTSHQVPRVLIGDGRAEDAERVRISGNEMTLPCSYFVSAERAVAAARAFWETGLPVESCVWAEFSPQL
jgi:hypothetical protein